MPLSRKQIFDALKKTDLVNISKRFGYRGLSVLTKEQLNDELLKDRSISKKSALRLLKLTDLKMLCLRSGVSSNGTKEALISNILGKKTEAKPPPKKSLPLFKTEITEIQKIQKIETHSNLKTIRPKELDSEINISKYDIKEKPQRKIQMKSDNIIFAPGARIVVRDAEWLVR